MKQLVSLNQRIFSDEQAYISSTDDSVLFGWGVFETMRLSNTSLDHLPEHIKRIISSCKALSIPLPIDNSALITILSEYIHKTKLKNCVVRLTILKGKISQSSSILVTNRPILYTQMQYIQGVTAMISKTKRNPTALLTYHKTTNYLDNSICHKEALQNGYTEVLFLNTENFLSEGSMSNIFFIKNNRLFTPQISCGLLPGIMRRTVIKELTPSVHLSIEEGTYSLKNLLNADEAFLTNSVMQIMPLVSINARPIGEGNVGKITGKLMHCLNLLSV